MVLEGAALLSTHICPVSLSPSLSGQAPRLWLDTNGAATEKAGPDGTLWVFPLHTGVLARGTSIEILPYGGGEYGRNFVSGKASRVTVGRGYIWCGPHNSGSVKIKSGFLF